MRLSKIWSTRSVTWCHTAATREGDIGLLVNSLQAHGQYRPIVANRRTNEVLAGNHTLEAALQLGWKTVAVTWVDVNDEQAEKIVLVDNKANDAAGYDYVTLAEMLKDMAITTEGLQGTGYDLDDLDEVLRLAGFTGQEAGLFLESFMQEVGTDKQASSFVGTTFAGEEVYKLVYAVTGDQRDLILTATNQAKENSNLDTSAEALGTICAEWLNL